MIYTALAFLAWLAAAPFIFILSFKKKYRTSLKARFFLYKNPKFSPASVHFHACSLGEVNALAPLISKFDSVALSTTTQTGFNAARALTPNSRYLPFENWLPFWLTGSRVLVIFEAELWLNLIRTAKSRGSYVILLNARISDRSYASYLRFKFYYRKAFENIDLVLAQSELDAARLRELGAKNIKVAGNVKSANIAVATKDYSAASANSFVLTISNTHEGEEELVLSNLNDFIKFRSSQNMPEKYQRAASIRDETDLPTAELRDEMGSTEALNLNATSLEAASSSDASTAVPNTAPLNGASLNFTAPNAAASTAVPQKLKIILAPRHPERFEKVREICEIWAREHGLSFERFSDGAGLRSDFILLDAFGELANFYKISNAVILGGSFLRNIGGHSPIEAASFGVPIISGRFFHNQKALYALVQNIALCEANEISSALKEPLKGTRIDKICDLQEIENLIKERI
ncbi:glycosyltransferase N-terminal domain-containing protein [uncultured Campylobacter sp.]|uniref:glycosyltransferase N-terminal domain-containing protein n=1 Tax=uncultured Campylobacter sp. TaxID=218934 RepID=UPI00261C1C52|nr:glycosyltransferase N-terminal domain-containing protein [uncultured Campylobacter sp.]